MLRFESIKDALREIKQFKNEDRKGVSIILAFDKYALDHGYYVSYYEHEIESEIKDIWHQQLSRDPVDEAADWAVWEYESKSNIDDIDSIISYPIKDQYKRSAIGTRKRLLKRKRQVGVHVEIEFQIN